MQRQFMDNVYDLIEESLEARQDGNHLRTAQLLLRAYDLLEIDTEQKSELKIKLFHYLANSYRDLGKLDLSKQFYEKAWQLSEEHKIKLDYAFYEDTYAQTVSRPDWELGLRIQRDFRSRLLQRQTIDQDRQVDSGSFSNYSRLRLKNLLRLTALYWLKGNYFEAEICLKEFINEEHGSTKTKLAVLALFALHQNKLDQAEKIYQQILSDSEFSSEDRTEILRQFGYLQCSKAQIADGQLYCRQASLLDGDFQMQPKLKDQFRAIAQVYCQKNCRSEAMKFCHAGIESFEFGDLGKPDHNSMQLILKKLGLTEDLSLLAKTA